MTTASISELKAHLSRYLREVRRGGEVQVLDRGVPIARLSGLTADVGDDAARRERLARSGIIRPGSGDVSGLLAREPIELPTSLLEILAEEREDRV